MAYDFEQLQKLLRETRSIRRFKEDEKISIETLKEIIGLTRFTPSGRNLQPLKYKIVNKEQDCDNIFPNLKWAGYLTDWEGPSEGERPAAYIIQCLDTKLANNLLCDDGIELETLVLGSRTLGLGSCIIKSFNASAIRNILNLSEELAPLYVLALGVPAEQSFVEDLDSQNDDVKYYRDENGIMHVPKRSVEERLI